MFHKQVQQEVEQERAQQLNAGTTKMNRIYLEDDKLQSVVFLQMVLRWAVVALCLGICYGVQVADSDSLQGALDAINRRQRDLQDPSLYYVKHFHPSRERSSHPMLRQPSIGQLLQYQSSQASCLCCINDFSGGICYTIGHTYRYLTFSQFSLSVCVFFITFRKCFFFLKNNERQNIETSRTLCM